MITFPQLPAIRNIPVCKQQSNPVNRRPPSLEMNVSLSSQIPSGYKPLVSFTGSIIEPQKLSRQMLQNSFIGFNQPIVDGYRHYPPAYFRMDDNYSLFFSNPQNELVSETIIVNRAKDPYLKPIIKEFKDALLAEKLVNKEDVLNYTAEYLDKKFSEGVPQDEILMEAVDYYVGERENWYLGEIAHHGAGVCRHRGLLFKVLCDDVLKPLYGIRGAAVAGASYSRSFDDFKANMGGHLWNLAHYKDDTGKNQVKIVDTMTHKIYDLHKLRDITSLDADARGIYFAPTISKTIKETFDDQLSWRPLYKPPLKPTPVEISSLEKDNFSAISENMPYSDFSQATLSYPDFAFSNLTSSTFSEAELDEPNFYLTNLSDANFRNTTMEGANFKNATLSDADMCGAKIVLSNFTGCTAHNAKFYNTDLNGATFQKADLTGAHFSDALMLGASLKEATLSHAYFDGACVWNTDFTDTVFNNTSFKNAVTDKKTLEKTPYLKDNYTATPLKNHSLKEMFYTLYPETQLYTEVIGYDDLVVLEKKDT